MIESMLLYAQAFIGVPYIWGGNNPLEGYDCSGFAQEVLASIGVDPAGDQTAQGLYNHLSKKKWRSTLRDGSILFFGDSRYNISHVEIALDTQRMIGASGGNSKTKTREDAAKRNAFVKIRPIAARNDLVAVIFPNIDNMSINNKIFDIM